MSKRFLPYDLVLMLLEMKLKKLKLHIYVESYTRMFIAICSDCQTGVELDLGVHINSIMWATGLSETTLIPTKRLCLNDKERNLDAY